MSRFWWEVKAVKYEQSMLKIQVKGSNRWRQFILNHEQRKAIFDALSEEF
jgi:hypothetical protein